MSEVFSLSEETMSSLIDFYADAQIGNYCLLSIFGVDGKESKLYFNFNTRYLFSVLYVCG